MGTSRRQSCPCCFSAYCRTVRWTFSGGKRFDCLSSQIWAIFNLKVQLEALHFADDFNQTESTETTTERAQILLAIEAAIQELPGRQREAFLLRYWEELDVAETASAMGCSVGSVKTHCSRAVAALASALREKGIRP